MNIFIVSLKKKFEWNLRRNFFPRNTKILCDKRSMCNTYYTRVLCSTRFLHFAVNDWSFVVKQKVYRLQYLLPFIPE